MDHILINFSKYRYWLNVIFVSILTFLMLRFTWQLFAEGLYPLASALSAVTVFLAIVYLRRHFTPVRWISIGIALSLMFTLYPILYTIYLSVTNMSSGHLMSKQQAITKLEGETYLAEDGQTYSWTGFVSSDDHYALWLMPDEGPGLLALPNQPFITAAPGEHGVGELDEAGIPLTIEGYERLPTNRTVALLTTLSEISFGEGSDAVHIASLHVAATLRQKYQYDSDKDAVVDLETGTVYRPVEGTFTSDDGEELVPGYIVYVGLRHFKKFLGNEGFREPLFKVFIWNVTFALGSVILSFGLGMVVTLLFEGLRGSRLIRALLIIPWPIPALVSILIWRSMLDPDVGFVTPMLQSLFGSSPSFFQDAQWTRAALILVNIWLSYPYFYVISAGAIRSIPHEIYDAAIVDGAGSWGKFRHITLPLVLRILTPLLIASFTFNFNNFNVIYIFNFGNPAMPNTIVPMGHTDILISFIYQLAFTSSNVTNFGLAAAITIMLFLLVSVMVLGQVRFTKLFKDAE